MTARLLAVVLLLASATDAAQIVGPDPPPTATPNQRTVKQGQPPLVPLKILDDAGNPLEGKIVKWIGPIGEGQVAVQCGGGLLASTATVGRHEFTGIIVPQTVTGPDDIEVVQYTLVVEPSGVIVPPPGGDPQPPPPGISTDLSAQAKQWLSGVPAASRGPKADVAKAIREIVNASPPLGITEMELFLGISLPFAIGDKLPDWSVFASSANTALNGLKSQGATPDQYRAALASIAGVLEQ